MVGNEGLAAWRLQAHLTAIAWGAPAVIAWRLAKVGREWSQAGFTLDPEWQQMVREKVEVGLDAQRVWAAYATRAVGQPFDGKQALEAAERSLRPIARKVRANVKRARA
ncbi:MAG: hypothetical protein EA356_11815 [Geminicoccaceae bacterium]|nr:MAG: hypothetical protein EA356_11815 [Geminicoccaceae bacterium]